MPSRRQIRESAFQILVYEAENDPSQRTLESRDRFWEFAEEIGRLLVVNRTKLALRHIRDLRDGLGDSHKDSSLTSQFKILNSLAAQILKPSEAGTLLKLRLEALALAEAEWRGTFEKVPKIEINDDHGTLLRKHLAFLEVLPQMNRIERDLDQLRQSVGELLGAFPNFRDLEEAYPSFKLQVQDLFSSITYLQSLSDKTRCSAISDDSPTDALSLTPPSDKAASSVVPTLEFFMETQCFRMERMKRPSTLAKKISRVSQVLAPTKSTDSLLDALSLMESCERKLATALNQLDRSTADMDPSDALEYLEPRIADIFALNSKLLPLRDQFLELLDQQQEYNLILEPVAGLTRRLQAISKRTEAIPQLSEHTNYTDIKRLRLEQKKLSELRIEADSLADSVLREKDRIDARLAEVVENFAPERIDSVDRAVLRLATWEILYNEQVPSAVAINEAIEIAKRFGTTDSGRFVNGVLDKIAKQASSAKG